VGEEGRKPWIYQDVHPDLTMDEMEEMHGYGWVPYLDCWEPDWAPEDSDDE